VYYPWHPLFDQVLSVYKSHSVDGVQYFVVRLADGTMSYLPKWMTEPVRCNNLVLEDQVTPSCEALDMVLKLISEWQEAKSLLRNFQTTGNGEGNPDETKISNNSATQSAVRGTAGKSGNIAESARNSDQTGGRVDFSLDSNRGGGNR
jgi:hypothetical protein